MMTQHYMPMARCLETGQTVKSLDLASKFEIHQESDARIQSEILARQVSAKTGRTWQPFVEVYYLDSEGRTTL